MSEKTWDVKVILEREAIFEVQVEADTEDEAIELAKSNVWADDYDYEERAASTIMCESYEAEEQIEMLLCPICEIQHASNTEPGINIDDFNESEKVIYTP